MFFSHGVLRDSVLVVPGRDEIRIEFALWCITVRASHLETYPQLSALISRREVGVFDPSIPTSINNLIRLLVAQGCLVPRLDRTSYALSEVRLLFSWFCNEWYGRYYAHPLWKIMRGSSIPLPVIRQWMSRTYFLSRFAGVTAAIASTSAPTEAVASAFRKSAIEEYSHCASYYSMPAALFGTAAIDVQVGPSSCFLAFDGQMASIAKGDWLAHLFVALFQEQTARYRDSANGLYDRIEAQLNHPGLFSGWREHIGFDEAHSHETELADLFDLDIRISHKQLQRSFDEASLAISLLIDGLDEVLASGARDCNPRHQANSLHLQESNVQGIRWLCKVEKHSFQASSSIELAQELADLVAAQELDIHLIASYLDAQTHALIDAALDCLAFCKDHEQIILVGKIVESSVPQSLPPSGLKKATYVTGKWLKRQAQDPERFAFLAYLNMQLIGRLAPERAYNIQLHHAIESAAAGLDRQIPLIDLLNIGLQWIDFLEYGYRLRDRNWPLFAVAM